MSEHSQVSLSFPNYLAYCCSESELRESKITAIYHYRCHSELIILIRGKIYFTVIESFPQPSLYSGISLWIGD